MVEELIIKLFMTERTAYDRFYKHLNLSYIKTNFVSLYKLFMVIHSYYEKSDKTSMSKSDLELAYHSSYLLEDSERNELSDLLDRILELELTEQNVYAYLNAHKQRCIAGEVAKLALDVEDGTAKVEELLNKFNELEHEDTETEEATPVNMDLHEIYESQIQTPGLRWRLDWLNKSLGSLRKGDFGFIFARPETGKTTFLASEMTHMVSQTDGDILWFNNEEQGKKVAVRCFQALFGLTNKELFNDKENNANEYKEQVGNRIKIYDYEDSSSTSRIESIIKNTNPALIIFDQIDKVRGFKSDRYDLELKKLYQWAREMAKLYAPVIAVSQAGGTGEGKVWLTMDDVDSSKTAKQGEADWILGIGKEQDNTSNMRYLNISKNKLLGDEDTLPDLRHGNQQVMIKPNIARYEEL
ncbi:DNA helicase [Methylophilales phage MEP401]|jgi:replicative DNA helicase|nr:DNA helicase [Methylophilales phage MEP401]